MNASAADLTAIRQALDLMIDRRSPDAKPAWFADIIDEWSWIIDDNGAQIHQVYGEWLMGEDVFRAEVPLHASVYPANNRDDLVALMHDCMIRHPDLADLCNSWVERWDNDNAQREQAQKHKLIRRMWRNDR